MQLTYPVIHKLVGKKFAEFLAGFEPAKQLTYLKDVAQLEWLFYLSPLVSDIS